MGYSRAMLTSAFDKPLALFATDGCGVANAAGRGCRWGGMEEAVLRFLARRDDGADVTCSGTTPT